MHRGKMRQHARFWADRHCNGDTVNSKKMYYSKVVPDGGQKSNRSILILYRRTLHVLTLFVTRTSQITENERIESRVDGWQARGSLNKCAALDEFEATYGTTGEVEVIRDFPDQTSDDVEESSSDDDSDDDSDTSTV